MRDMHQIPIKHGDLIRNVNTKETRLITRRPAGAWMIDNKPFHKGYLTEEFWFIVPQISQELRDKLDINIIGDTL